MSDHTELDATIACLGLEYSAVFVPQSQSQNASEKSPSLNWRVSVKNAGRVLTTDYFQGIGHLPKLPANVRNLRMAQEYERTAAEKGVVGRYFAGGIHWTGKPVPAPLLRDVLYALVTDSAVIDYARFEDWADAFGYNTDSRKSEKVYRACLEIALQLRAILGDTNLNQLSEAFQDY